MTILYNQSYEAYKHLNKTASVILANMANRSRLKVLKGEYRPSPKLAVPLVSSLHPATTILSQVVKSSFTSGLSKDPVLEVILPPSSLIAAYTKIPNLQLLLSPNDQNKLATNAPTQFCQWLYGYWLLLYGLQSISLFKVDIPSFNAWLFPQDS